MTDHEAEARMVAEALGGRIYATDDTRTIVVWTNRDGDESAIRFSRCTLGDQITAIRELARRLRETEQERNEWVTEHWRLYREREQWKVTAADQSLALDMIAKQRSELEQERDELRGVVRGLEQALFLATSGRETGVAEPGDHITSGYGVVVADEWRQGPECEADCRALDGAASVPVKDWMDAQDDFGRRTRRDGG